jgi:hypothetical protein
MFTKNSDEVNMAAQPDGKKRSMQGYRRRVADELSRDPE